MKPLHAIAPLFLFHFVMLAQPSILWQKSLGGQDFEEATAIYATMDGGQIAAGYAISNDGDVTGNHGGVDIWVVKTNNSGQMEWQRCLGGSKWDYPWTIIQAPDGNYMLAACTESNNGDVEDQHGDKDAWLVKLSGEGEMIWQKPMGGSGWDEARGITVDNDGNYIMCGTAGSSDGDLINLPGPTLDYWIVKLTPDGEILWQVRYGGSREEFPHALSNTSDHGVVIIGETKSSDGDVIGNNGNVDFWVVKLDSVGRLEWQHALGGTGWDVGQRVFETSTGYWVSGYVGSLSSGDVTVNHGLFDYWVAKLDKNGALVWQKSFGGSDADWGYDGMPTNNGGYLLAGTTRSDNGDVTNVDGGQDVWVLEIDSAGNILWNKTYGGSVGETGLALCKATDGNLVVCGASTSTDGDVTVNHGSADFWIVKLALESTSAAATPAFEPLQVFPNPGHDQITVRLPGLAGSERLVRCYDALGRVVLTTEHETLDTSFLPPGWYLITALAEDGKWYVAKWLKN